MRAFIFSLDAFVAFTLALMAIYSLIFFSSVPSAYYFLLTQGHYLSRDTLLALSLTQCTDSMCDSIGSSYLDNIIIENRKDNDKSKALVMATVGHMIPRQFGYTLEVSSDQGVNWDRVYDTYSEGDTGHQTGSGRKFAVATQILNFGYSGKVKKLATSPYQYNSCQGQGMAESPAPGGISGGATETTTLGLITCGWEEITNSDGTTTKVPFGNMKPDDIIGEAGTDLVPSSEVSLVKLIVYI
jgi:hypothetical protein